MEGGSKGELPSQLSLPRELWLFIFSFLRVKEKGNIALTCNHWNKFSKDDATLWKDWFFRDFPFKRHLGPLKDDDPSDTWQNRYR